MLTLSDQFALLDKKMVSVTSIATKFGDRLQVHFPSFEFCMLHNYSHAISASLNSAFEKPC